MLAITRKPSPLLETGERTHIGRDPIDPVRALAQHDGYRAALRECGLDERRLDDADTFPDGVFIEDTAVVFDELAVITRPGAASRRPEIAGVEETLAPLRRIERIQTPATLDGGDVVVVGKRVLVGESARTSAAGITALTRILRRYGYRVSSVGMHGCLHLKSGCTALPGGRLIVNDQWIDVDDLVGFDLVRVPASEPWGGDVAIAHETIVAAAAYPATIELLIGEGFVVKPVDVSEFAKAEGGVTCMSLILRDRQG